MQLVYKHLEEQAAVDDSGETDLAAEEEALLHGGNQDYPQQVMHAVDNLHESSVISICCWPGDNSRAITGSGNFVAYMKTANMLCSVQIKTDIHSISVKCIVWTFWATAYLEHCPSQGMV
jgi:hypothetical protein